MLAQFNIILPKPRQIFNFFLAQFSFDARRTSHYKRARRNFGVRRNQTSSGDERISADARAVQNNRADSNQTAGFDITAVQRHAMSERYFVFQNRVVRFRGDVNYRSVLNICPRADANRIHVGAQNRAVPNARLLADFDIADDNGVFGDKSSFVNSRFDAAKRFD